MYRAGLGFEDAMDQDWERLHNEDLPDGAYRRVRSGYHLGTPGALVRAYPWPSKQVILTVQRIGEVVAIGNALRAFTIDQELTFKLGGFYIESVLTARRWWGTSAPLPPWAANTLEEGACPGSAFCMSMLGEFNRRGYCDIVCSSHRAQLMESSAAWRLPNGGAPYVENELACGILYDFGPDLKGWTPFPEDGLTVMAPPDPWAGAEVPVSLPGSSRSSGTTLSRG